MNYSKIKNYGAVLNKFHQYLPFFRSVNNEMKHPIISNTAFFSHFCNSFRSTEPSKLIQTPFSALILNARGYKVRGHLQLRCKDCYMARKDGEMYVFCPTYPRHNQRKLTKRKKYTWILTYAFMSKFRPY